MERLTEKHYIERDGYYTKCSETCFLEAADCGGCEKIGALVDRLGAYEDTGLMPEEIMAAIAANDTARTFVEKMADFGGAEAVKRLRELAEADKDGRVVVLPCKVGDTVFTIYQDCVMECSVEFVNIGKFAGGTVVLCRKGRCADQYGLPLSGFNSSTFATREEAEQALKEAKEDG